MRVHVVMLTLTALVFSACGGGAGGSGGGASSSGGKAPDGAIATGLQTATDGWSFPNFPSSAYADVNFDETDLVSMFGSDETICVGGVATPCKLTAEAAAWARMVNQARASGHCEGLVALASSRFNNKETPSTVKLPSQQETLHAIMRTFATQFLPEVQESIGKWMAASFEDKIDEMKKSFAAGTLQYTLGVYTAGGGHAVLPYAIEYPTPDTPRVMLYDSNWPGKNRYVDIDLKDKTWRFSFSGADPANDPDVWTGGPQDMDLTPLEAREGTCPFCGKDVKVAKTTMLIRSANLDWSVETDGGVVSPANPDGADGTTVNAVKGSQFSSTAGSSALKKDSYDYLVSVPVSVDSEATPTSGATQKKRKSKLKFSGATSVYALMPEGIAQFTTPGSAENPVEVEGSSISTTDPGVDLTLASGNLVANASGSAVSLSIEGDTMAVAVTAANGQVIKQEVSADQPTVQMKADPEGGGITVLAASATGVVEKTEVSSTGETTKSVVTEALNLSEVKAELPPELASKENAALPSLATRDMANPDYKVDAAYSAPTTIPAKGGDQVAEAVQTTQAKGQNAATPTSAAARGATTNVNESGSPTTVKRTVAAVTSGSGTAAAVALKPSLGRFSLPGVTFGDAAFTIDEPSSNSSGGWKFTSSKPDVVEVSALTGRATVKGAGTTTITATQSAVKGFEQASITALLIVARDTPVLGAYTTSSRTFGDESFVLKNPTSNSTGVFSVDSSDESVAKFSKTSGKLIITGAGKTTITATQAATDNYLGASKSFVLTVKKATPELGVFDDFARTFGEAGFTLAKPSSDSRAAITLSSSNPAVATVDGASGAVTIVGAGTTTFTAAQAANADFFAASKTMTFTVRQATPTLGAMTGASKTFGDASFSLTKPSSPSSGSFSFSSNNTGVVSVDGDGKVSIVGAGTATITATQAATVNYKSSSAAAVVTIGRASTIIANLSLSNMTYGDSGVTLAPRSNNPSPFTFTSNAPTVLEVSSTGRVTVVGAGEATITVRQASSANYEAGAEALTVQIGRATTNLSSFSAISKDYGDAPFTLTPPVSNSPAPFTYASSDPSIASINSLGVVTIHNVTVAGTPVILTVQQAQTVNYAASSATTTLTIGRGAPVFGNFTIAPKQVGENDFTVTAPTSTSGASFTYSIDDEPNKIESDIATVVDASTGEFHIVGPGEVRVRATQIANTLYVSSSITATFTVTIATLTVTTDEQGGSPINSVSTTIGGTISSSPGTPSRSGYTFNGWSTTSTGGSGLAVTVYDNSGYGAAPPMPAISGKPVVGTTTQADIDHSFDSEPLFGLTDGFIVKYEGYITSPVSTNIVFYPYADDGTKFYLDGVLIDDNWVDKGGGGNATSAQHFSAGVPRQITYWFYENGAGANTQLYWDIGNGMEIVPASAFNNIINFPYTHNQTTNFTLYAQYTPTCATGGTCILGDTGPGGGKVFYVHTSGTFACGPTLTSTCKYLEAAPTTGTSAWVDQNYLWSGNTTGLIGSSASGVSIGTGYSNTLAIVGQSGGGDTSGRAATVTRAYRGPNSLSDWFLPSQNEVYQLHLNNVLVSLGESFDDFWSSTEGGSTSALITWNHGDGSFYGNDKDTLNAVRPIRAFG